MKTTRLSVHILPFIRKINYKLVVVISSNLPFNEVVLLTVRPLITWYLLWLYNVPPLKVLFLKYNLIAFSLFLLLLKTQLKFVKVFPSKKHPPLNHSVATLNAFPDVVENVLSIILVW